MKMYTIIATVTMLLLIGGAVYYQYNNTENKTVVVNNPLPESPPVQTAIKQAIENGNLSAEDIDGPPEYSTQIIEKNETRATLKSTTKLKFKNPKGAGIKDDKWPKFEIVTTIGNVAVSGDNVIGNMTTNSDNTTTINYDQQIKDSIYTEIKNIQNDAERAEINDSWKNYSFESGPRTYEVNETYEVIFTNDSAINLINTLPINETISTHDYEILMGFTEPIYWKYSKEENFYVRILWWNVRIAWVKADIEIDAVLGLRLPTRVSLDTPNMMIIGRSYNISTRIKGEDWDASKYSLANVPPEDGNEFVARMRLSLFAQAWIRVIGNIGPYNINKDLDYSKSFKTPFGSNEKFPIPELILPPEKTGLKIYAYYNILWAGVGLKIEPVLGSDKITAKWDAEGDSTGNGMIEYNEPDISYNFGPIKAGDYDDSIDNASIKLSEYNYYLSICKLNLHANIQGGLTVLPLAIESPYIIIYSYNCGGFTKDIHFGVHSGTSADSVNSYIIVVPETYRMTGNVAIDNTAAENTNVIPSNTAVDNINVTSTVTPTETPTVTPTETPTVTPAETPTVTPAETPTVTPTETPTVTPTETPTVTPTETPTVTPTETPTVTPTETPTVTPTETPTVTPTETPTVTPTETPTVTPTETPTVTPTEDPYGIGNGDQE